MNKRRLLWGGAVLAVWLLTGLLIWVLAGRPEPPPTPPAGFERIEVGMGEAEVAALLGRPPDRRVRTLRTPWQLATSQDRVFVLVWQGAGATVSVDLNAEGKVLRKAWVPDEP
jgi:hypothetical protein